MDYLVDLQRDGLIKSISGRNFPSAALKSLYGCGFHLDSHQLDCNLLIRDPLSYEHRMAAQDLNLPHLFANPLCGGLLSRRFEDRMFPPLVSEVGRARSIQFRNSLQKWAKIKQHEDETPSVHEFLTWNHFQKHALPPIRDIASKYDVSTASVALRWVLQQNMCQGTVVGSKLVGDPDNKEECLSRRLKSFRDVFRFELDEEDLDILWKIADTDEVSFRNNETPNLYDDNLGKIMENKKLWL